MPDKLHNMPNLPPISSGRLIFAQQAEINAIQAAAIAPNDISAKTVPAVLSLGIHKPRMMIAEDIPHIVVTLQTPNLSARNPQEIRPKKAPVWRMAIA